MTSGPAAQPHAAPAWIRPGPNSPAPWWGIDGGIQFALWPAAIDGVGDGGPRGLVRVGYPAFDGKAGLVNFIAAEPEVLSGAPKGFSELEWSADGRPGKQMLTDGPEGRPDPGTITHPDPSRPDMEELAVTVRVERFANGAHPYLRLAIRSDRPDELRLQVFAEPDSAPMSRCILTATMGNFARVRRIALRGEAIDAGQLYSDYRGDGFAPDTRVPLERLARDAGDGVVVPMTTDESHPEIVVPFPGSSAWAWKGRRVTQYWRKEPGTFGPALELRVNARYVYWQSQQPIPGGIAFENVELREPYRPGVASIFGITLRAPRTLIRGDTGVRAGCP